jgi:hypothetical protein
VLIFCGVLGVSRVLCTEEKEVMVLVAVGVWRESMSVVARLML